MYKQWLHYSVKMTLWFQPQYKKPEPKGHTYLVETFENDDDFFDK